jgi:hypothetical protein
MKSAALSRSCRKNPDSVPAKLFVPDFVIAFTCTPAERPWVASNRFVTN